MSELIFAYGSNMCSGRLRDYGVAPEGKGRPAVLTGYTLTFDKKSTADGSGKANASVLANSNLWGVVYEISADLLSMLDKGEGGYRRQRLPVRLADGSTAEVWTYSANKPSNDPELRPYTWYKRFIIEGAREHGLPAEYIAQLEHIQAVDDPDKQRDGRKRSLTCRSAL